MVYPFLAGGTLLRIPRTTLPRTFCRYGSITAAIERGRQGDRDGPPRRERDEGGTSRRSSRFGRVGPPRPRDDEAPSRWKEERALEIGGEQPQSDEKEEQANSRWRWRDRPWRERSWRDRPKSAWVESGMNHLNTSGSLAPRQKAPSRADKFLAASPSDGASSEDTRLNKPSTPSSDRSERFTSEDRGNGRREFGRDDRGGRRDFGGDDRGGRRDFGGDDRGGRRDFGRDDRGGRRDFGRDDRDGRREFGQDDRGGRRTEFGRDDRLKGRREFGRDDRRSEGTDFGRDDRRNGRPEFGRDERGGQRTEFGKDDRRNGRREFGRDERGGGRTESGRDDRRNGRREFAKRDGDAPREAPGPVRDPESLPYTTAASEFIYGHSSVLAAIKAGRRKFYTLYILARGVNREGLMSRIRAQKLFPITKEVGDEYMRAMDKASSGRPHNGVVLESSPLPVPPITELKTASIEDESFSVALDSQSAEDLLVNGKQELYLYKSGGWRHPLILYVDGVVEEGNLGAIARSAYVLGADAIVTPTHHTANWSHIALKASAGAAEAIPVFKVGQPTDFLGKSSRAGWRIYASGAVPPASSMSASTGETPDAGPSKVVYTFARSTKRLPANHSPVAEHPTILMMGAEATGLKTGLLNLAHYNVGIPHGREVNEVGVDSLNVSVAASILCYEMLQKPTAQPEKDAADVLF